MDHLVNINLKCFPRTALSALLQYCTGSILYLSLVYGHVMSFELTETNNIHGMNP